MTPEDFAKMAMGFAEATESPHFHKTSFRIRKKIFATMDSEKRTAVLKLSPETQAHFCGISGGSIYPVKGAWGEKGWTETALEAADKDLLFMALKTAYCGVAPKKIAAQYRA